MLFNSIEFAIFLPVVFALYWFVTRRNLKAQNVLILVASYVFYGWWDWRFLSLIIFSSLVDYSVGLGLARTDDRRQRKLLLIASIVVNIGLLGFFKYFNFFSESFARAFTLLGRPIDAGRLNIVLPVGISFYTFQTLSYTIDVYRRELEPTRDIVAFLSFVSFFPQLVAGPIERAAHLLPQFRRRRSFEIDQAVDGMRQILWGLFKKVVIADNCATYADAIFANHSHYAANTLLLGVVVFAFQIYCDFSGYSDIAIGTARLFGFRLMRNFNYPYFSRDIAEFWRRWHISLTSWFRDYVYIPLGGSRRGVPVTIRNIFIVFLLSGFWHGANWTFLVWGFVNACYFLPLMLLKLNRRNIDTVAEGRIFPSLKEAIQMAITFLLTLFAWVFFRADSVPTALSYLKSMLSPSLFRISVMDIKKLSAGPHIIYLFLFLFIFLLIEWLQRGKQHALQFEDGRFPLVVRWCVYYAVAIIIFWFQGAQQEFIYFQF